MEYDDDEWLVPARDNLGQSVRAFFRIPPMMDKAIEIIVNSKVFPFKTRADFHRHAILRELGFLHRLEPRFPRHFLSALHAVLEIVRDDEMRSQMEGVFNGLAARIEAHLQRGDMGEAVRVAALTKSQLLHLEDSAWRRRFMARFNRQFVPLLQGEVVVEPKLRFEPPQRSLPPGRDEDED